MGGKIGESLQREWDEDAYPGELWDALQTRKQDHKAGIEALTELAERGSALAMMYLGYALSEGDSPNDIAEAERWLTRSAEAGSLEGRFQLADLYLDQGNGSGAVAEFEAVAERGYGPAMFRLGLLYYQGKVVERDIPATIQWLNRAKAAGHLPAMAHLARIYHKGGFGIAGRFAAHWNCATKIPGLLWYILRYPNSDRLRGFPWPSSNGESTT